MKIVKLPEKGRWTLNKVLLLSLIPLLVVLIWSGLNIVPRHMEYHAARLEYAHLRERAGIESVLLTSNGSDSVTEGIDWDALRAINPDIVGWIVVPGTDICYPIVQGTDNAWYLGYTFSEERNASGAIFLDSRNDSRFSDGHSLIYGHNMRDGSMFAQLHGFTGDRFEIHTPDEQVLEYEVFARQTVSATHHLYSTLDSVREDGREVVTLSTCVFRRPNVRYIVQGVRLESN